jgi:hypothetical protein
MHGAHLRSSLHRLTTQCSDRGRTTVPRNIQRRHYIALVPFSLKTLLIIFKIIPWKTSQSSVSISSVPSNSKSILQQLSPISARASGVPRAEDEQRDPELGPLRTKAEHVAGLLLGSAITRHNEDRRRDQKRPIHTLVVTASLLPSDAFAGVLLGKFKRTNKIEYLNESISTLHEALGRPFQGPFAQHLRSASQGPHSLALFTRSVSFPAHWARGDDERYFLEPYIPSYTSTLSALIHESGSRKHTSSPHHFS